MVIYFDGSICKKCGCVGVVFIAPQGIPIPYYFKLNFPYTNKNVKYEALILAIRTASKLKLKKIKFIDDSLLVVN